MALLDYSTDSVWEAFMAEPVHDDIGDGFHLGIIRALSLPVNAAGKTGNRAVQGLVTGRVDRLRSPLFVTISAGVGSVLLPSSEAFSSSTSALPLALTASSFRAWSAAFATPSRRTIVRQVAGHILWPGRVGNG